VSAVFAATCEWMVMRSVTREAMVAVVVQRIAISNLEPSAGFCHYSS